MASLHSLPEDLVGVIYSLLPDRASKRAFLSSCSGVRRAPSVICQITMMTITANELANCHVINPLASLPQGVCLKELIMELSEDASLLTALLHPGQESARMRVQNTLDQLQKLRLYCPDRLYNAHGVGSCLKHLTIAELELGLESEDVSPLLAAMSSGPAARSLNILRCDQCDGDVSLPDLAAFTSLTDISLVFTSIRDFTPLTSLPKLEKALLNGDGNIWEVLPRFPRLKRLAVGHMPQQVPPLHSSSLEELVVFGLYLVAFSNALSHARFGALPKLRRVIVDGDAFHAVFNTTTIADPHAFNSSLALSLACLASPEIVLCSCVTDSFDAFAELCELCPAMRHGVKYLRVEETDEPATRIRALPALCPNLTRLRFEHTADGVAELMSLSSAIQGMESIIQVDIFGGYNSSEIPAGVSAALTSLLVQAACKDRVETLSVGYGAVCEDPRTVGELRALEASWAVILSALQQSQCPCKVEFDMHLAPGSE